MNKISCFIVQDTRSLKYLKSYALNRYIEPDFYWTDSALSAFRIYDYQRLKKLRHLFPSNLLPYLDIHELTAETSFVDHFSPASLARPFS